MSRTSERLEREQQISVINWMFTLLISSIPLVNIIVFIAWQFMPVKKARKRFALAALLLMLLMSLLVFVAFMIWGPQIVEWLRALKI